MNILKICFPPTGVSFLHFIFYFDLFLSLLLLQLWLCLAESKIDDLDWSKTAKFCFNEKSNPDDDELGSQIVKVGVFKVILISTVSYFYLSTFSRGSRGRGTNNIS